MTHPGVRPVTARATEAFLRDPQRFADGKALASYVGLIPRERSSGARQRLGALTKQGSPLLRFVWGEAGAHAARPRSRLTTILSPQVGAEGTGESARGGSAQARNPAMDHAARSDRLPRVLSSWTEAKRCGLCRHA